MRQLYFLVPGTSGKFRCGGLWAELNTLDLAKQVCAAELVTYRQREPESLFLEDLLQSEQGNNAIFVVSWGFDVAKLIPRLAAYPVVYHAHSAGYRLQLPARVPIITVSRNTMGYWGQQAPNCLIYYLPNQIADKFRDLGRSRDIDVLVQARKSSEYLIQQLIPALQRHCRVMVVNSYVENLAELFNRTKVYLYDSAEYWAQQGVSEGFGLQPMEALACGCQVFSSVNGGLSDYLDPGFNCHKIAGYSLAYDVQRVLNALTTANPLRLPAQVLEEHRAESITRRFKVILEEVNTFFDHQSQSPPSIANLTHKRIAKLRIQTIFRKLKEKF